MTNTRGKLAKGIMVGAEEKMSTELNAGADWEQSRRLVVHWHDMWSIQKREKELLKRKLDIAIKALQFQHCHCECGTVMLKDENGNGFDVDLHEEIMKELTKIEERNELQGGL